MIFVIVGLLAACEKEDEVAGIATKAFWKGNSMVKPEQGVATILMEGTVNTSWTADIVKGNDWCSFAYQTALEQRSGSIKAGTNALYVYYSDNTSAGQREAEFQLHFGDGTLVNLQLIQQTEGEVVLPDFGGGWVEVPVMKANADYEYVVHYTNVNGKEVRNYSLCYDKTRKCALWVAYPLHRCYIGSVSRTDAWQYDPFIEEQWQPNLFKSYRGSYDRGHQLPSGDRTATRDMNEQTFYFSNMTPQMADLNQKMWMNLENKVRSYNCSDTLYVVTGAVFDENCSYTFDSEGERVPIPTAYYKVLLRTKNGQTGKWVKQCDANELKSIGFWVEHKDIYGDQPTKAICTTVSDIEKKTGFTFFPGISNDIKEDDNTIEWNF